MNEQSLRIGKKTFFTSVIILFSLMIFVGILTRLIEPGAFERVIRDGREMVVADSFRYSAGADYPVWRWFIAPAEVLFSKDSIIIITIIIFLLIVGGAVSVLNSSGVLSVTLDKAAARFKNRKYMLMAVITLIFMLFGAFFGIFEEVVPLVPIIIALSLRLGWDRLTGLGMSILAAGFGFSAAVSNPFTIGVAQGIAGLPMFSGALFRILVFAVTYSILIIFLYRHSKKVHVSPDEAALLADEAGSTRKNCTKGSLIAFFTAFVLMILLLLSSAVTDALSDYTLPLIGLIFLMGGLGSGFLSKLKSREVLGVFLKGISSIAPAIILILMAASIKHIISSGGIMDTILYHASRLIENSGDFAAVAAVFFLVLAMNFFIGSGSAKAFLIMPIIVPLADLLFINRQIMVLAFQFGDGFSNCIYPTNPVVLIALGLCSVSYAKWFRFTAGLQAVMILMNILLLGLALLVNYGPF
jgi:uncharacterized ion transporter superfamily protein YfcC